MMMKQQKVVLEDNTISKVGGFHAKPVGSFCSEEKDQENGSYFEHPPPSQSQPSLKRKRNLPGNPGLYFCKFSLHLHIFMFFNSFFLYFYCLFNV